MNINFKLFLMAVVYPKDDNSKNIYNLIDEFYDQFDDIELAENELHKLTNFICILKIKNANYIAFWMKAILESLMYFDAFFTDGDNATMLREDFHCVYGNEHYKLNTFNTADKFLFVMQKYGFEKCLTMCGFWHDNHDDCYFDMMKEMPVYDYFGLRECVDYLPLAVETIKKRQLFLNDMSLHFEIFHSKHTKHVLGLLHNELQKRECDGIVEHAFADEYIMARICGYFSMSKK